MGDDVKEFLTSKGVKWTEVFDLAEVRCLLTLSPNLSPVPFLTPPAARIRPSYPPERRADTAKTPLPRRGPPSC
eukprot:8767407-Pyramimonas_sp.AAC.1